jgi:hypothetical protein
MNIVDATLTLRKGGGGEGRGGERGGRRVLGNTKEKLGQVFSYYGMAWSM